MDLQKYDKKTYELQFFQQFYQQWENDGFKGVNAAANGVKGFVISDIIPAIFLLPHMR